MIKDARLNPAHCFSLIESCRLLIEYRRSRPPFAAIACSHKRSALSRSSCAPIWSGDLASKSTRAARKKSNIPINAGLSVILMFMDPSLASGKINAMPEELGSQQNQAPPRTRKHEVQQK